MNGEDFLMVFDSIVATVLFWLLIGVLALYFLGARLAGPAAGAGAATLLALHLIQVWHARIPNSEVLAQALLLAGLLALARAEQARSEPVPVALDAIVAGRCDAWDAFAAERHVHIVSDVAGYPYALVTPGRLEQIVRRKGLCRASVGVLVEGRELAVSAGTAGDEDTAVGSGAAGGLQVAAGFVRDGAAHRPALGSSSRSQHPTQRPTGFAS